MQRKVRLTFMLMVIIIPLILTYWDIRAGTLLLVFGVYLIYRLMSHGGLSESTTEQAKAELLRQEQGNRGRTFYIQVVDDYGNDLPADILEQHHTAAYAQAGPRDTVIEVRRPVGK